MEYEIGQEIELINDELGNITVKVEEQINPSCKDCIFASPICARDKYHLEDAYCSSLYRSDEKSIIYKQIK